MGMLVVETIAKIRRAYFAQNKPIKTISRELRVSPKVVRFEAAAELGPIDQRRGGIIRAVVGLGKPIELLGRLEEPRTRPIGPLTSQSRK